MCEPKDTFQKQKQCWSMCEHNHVEFLSNTKTNSSHTLYALHYGHFQIINHRILHTHTYIYICNFPNIYTSPVGPSTKNPHYERLRTETHIQYEDTEKYKIILVNRPHSLSIFIDIQDRLFLRLRLYPIQNNHHHNLPCSLVYVILNIVGVID